MRRLPHCIVLLATLCRMGLAHAQTTQSVTHLVATNTTIDASTTDAPSEVQARLLHEEAEREVRLEETQRILVVVPNFNTVVSGHAAPLDKAQKTELALHATADPFNLIGAFVLAGASELTGSHRGFGWGPGGYTRRVGANLADVADGTMLAGAVYPILLHQDPRFFRQGTGTIKSRLGHALMGPFVARGDNGRPQFNYSNILGNFTAGAISNAYYPSSETGASLTLINSTIVTVEGSLGNIGLEFAPDVAAYWHRRRDKSATASTPTPQATP